MASTSKKLLFGAQALTATTTSDPQTLSPRWKNFVATMFTTAHNAATTVTVTLEHSSDGTNWHTLKAFSAIVGAAGIECENITVGVLGHVRASAVLAGGTQAATVTVELNYDTDK